MKKVDYIKNQDMQNKLKVLMIFLFLTLMACRKDQVDDVKVKYGLNFNNKRKEIGLAELPSNWVCFPPTPSGRYVWMGLTDHLGIPKGGLYNAKVLLIKNDTLVSETDEFVNSNYFNTPYGISVEYLLFIYSFTNYDDFTIGWDYYYGGDLEKGMRGYVTKVEADSILKSWEQQRIPFLDTAINYK